VKNRFRDMKQPELNGDDISELDIPDTFSLEDQAELNEIMRCLDEGLNTLSEKSREIFARFYFFGERTPEIARITGLSEGAVRSTLSKTRSKLKEFLMKRGFDNYV
ncbi:MAG: sigma-70 family RNA polymerase sigma factor, partial [Oscillospiraceae bacterium]|nr:sigma-70 family RNA polymerase sigma factor [Oscillospiraceae bacterium]